MDIEGALTPVKASMVIACRNEIRHIQGFLESVLNQEMDGLDWEVIVADGVSTDGTRAVLDEWARRNTRLTVLNNTAKTVSAGLNAAIRAANGSIILRLDAHTAYARDYCRRCIETLEQTGAENVGGPARTVVSGTRARAIAAAYHSRFSTGGARFHDESFEGWVDTVPYGCWRKRTLEQLGLFDEALIRNQDDELNLRIIRSGGRIWQNPAIVSWYSPRATLTALFLQYFQYGFWKVAVIRKHRLPSSWRHLVPGMFVLANALLLATIALTALGLVPSWLGFEVAGRLWLAFAGVYVIANMTASAIAANRNGWKLLPLLPPAFAVFHFSWGLGFLAGIRWFLPQPSGPFGDSVFTRLSH